MLSPQSTCQLWSWGVESLKNRQRARTSVDKQMGFCQLHEAGE